jgi:phage tail tube protein FII
VGPKNLVQKYFQNKMARGEIDRDEYDRNFRGCVARKGSEAHRLVACMVEEHKKAQPQKRKAVDRTETTKTLAVST